MSYPAVMQGFIQFGSKNQLFGTELEDLCFFLEDGSAYLGADTSGNRCDASSQIPRRCALGSTPVCLGLYMLSGSHTVSAKKIIWFASESTLLSPRCWIYKDRCTFTAGNQMW